MGIAPASPAVIDWTDHSAICGGLTRKYAKSAVVRLDGLAIVDDGHGDLDPAARNNLIFLGWFRVPAMDDGHPDPVPLSHLLRVQFGISAKLRSIMAFWGNRTLGCAVAPPAATGETAPAVTLFHLSPMQVQLNLKALREQAGPVTA